MLRSFFDFKVTIKVMLTSPSYIYSQSAFTNEVTFHNQLMSLNLTRLLPFAKNNLINYEY